MWRDPHHVVNRHTSVKWRYFHGEKRKKIREPIIFMRECLSCGASIAALLDLCPYCSVPQPEKNRIPAGVKKLIMNEIKEMTYAFHYPRFSMILLFWLSSLHIFIIPVACSIILQVLFKSWILTGLFLAAACGISFILMRSIYEHYQFGRTFHAKIWRYQVKPRLLKTLRRHRVPESALKGLIWEYLQTAIVPDKQDINMALYE